MTEQKPVTKQYNNTPSHKRRMQYQRQLVKLVAAGERGELKNFGRAAIKRYVSCGDDRAAALQADLVEQGYATAKGRTIAWTGLAA